MDEIFTLTGSDVIFMMINSMKINLMMIIMQKGKKVVFFQIAANHGDVRTPVAMRLQRDSVTEIGIHD